MLLNLPRMYPWQWYDPHQVEYHPFQQPKHLMEYCRQEGIVFEGYSPLAKGQVLDDPAVLRIAQKYGRTPAQICIRWSIQVQIFPAISLIGLKNKKNVPAMLCLFSAYPQNGVVTIPKSINKKRIQENCQVRQKWVVFFAWLYQQKKVLNI